MPNVFANHHGTWKKVQLIWVNDNGVWRPLGTGYVNNTGAYSQFYPDAANSRGNNILLFNTVGVDHSWTVPAGITSINLEVVGGGGGGGGGDGGRSGYSGYAGAKVDITSLPVMPGQTLRFQVGGGGGGGIGGTRGVGGGIGGAHIASPVIFATRANSISGTQNYVNNAYSSFLNEYGIWNLNDIHSTYFDKNVTVNFPVTGSYTFTSSCDNYGSIYLDGQAVINPPHYRYHVQTTITVTAGNHNIRIYGVNTGGPGCIALKIEGQSVSYAGGRGGHAGHRGSSGGGGGGGGATVIYKGSDLLAIAGGGGGGGGSGLHSGGQGQASPVVYNTGTPGGNGQDKSGDGGGGGGGGGGYRGGAGGVCRGGDDGAFSGFTGESLTSGGTLSLGVNAGSGSGNTGAAGTAGYVKVTF